MDCLEYSILLVEVLAKVSHVKDYRVVKHGFHSFACGCASWLPCCASWLPLRVSRMSYSFHCIGPLSGTIEQQKSSLYESAAIKLLHVSPPTVIHAMNSITTGKRYFIVKASIRNGRLWVVSYPRIANSRTVAASSEEEDTALALEL